MPALARFESFMENMVEGSVARLFRSPVQPAEIAKRLERAMETQQTISVRREMATYLAELAQERGFTMLEHPTVELNADASVPRHGIQVIAETSSAGPP